MTYYDDLISRAAAIDAIVSETAFPFAEYIKALCQDPANSEDWLGGVCDAITAVENVNAVDAAPVVHGRWNVILNPFWDAECSECGYTKKNGWEWRFCPNCGAKMDEEATEYGKQDEDRLV